MTAKPPIVPIHGLWMTPLSWEKWIERYSARDHRAVLLTPEEFHYAFTNTMTEEESEAVYERYAVPGPGRVLFQGALANFNPRAATAVDYRNDDRAPLLFIAGGEDHVIPQQVDEAQAHEVPQVRRRDRLQGVPRPLALHDRPGRLGGCRRLRARLGARAHGVGHATRTGWQARRRDGRQQGHRARDHARHWWTRARA